jgi:hypothetical protein
MAEALLVWRVRPGLTQPGIPGKAVLPRSGADTEIYIDDKPIPVHHRPPSAVPGTAISADKPGS